MSEDYTGLRIPSMGAGIGSQEEQQIHLDWDTFPGVQQQLEEMGIFMPVEPNFECPTIHPGSLIAMSSIDYTTLYEKLLGWYGYLGERVAHSKSMLAQCENEMTYIEVMLKKKILDTAESARIKKPAADVLRIKVETEPRFVELKLLAQRYEQLKNAQQGRLNTVEAQLKVVSRHIEIRKVELEGTRTGSNINSREHERQQHREQRSGLRG